MNPSLGVNSAAELVALAKSRPGQLSFASFGNGASNHLSGEMLKSLTGIQATHVPYKSAPQAVTDLIAGQTAFAFVNTPLALPHVRSGKLKALAVTGAKRSAGDARIRDDAGGRRRRLRRRVLVRADGARRHARRCDHAPAQGDARRRSPYPR